ncbi:dolichyl-diphosphooligosaccharide--protein glycosyltransferase subunit 4B-like [Arachis duranensis]|uniref:Dolichyl-diphosphooligosaccharide--protein glycosyltransferase subunit 4B-like n=1 Tax=Arachis duranensis TaxID=130453 RepID=A0A6P4CQ25_ARADU|nr:dolichyl-diphosphooligosaccharide--protein glycosyltransferase subunit 4B-like [Arachis duranensis]
MFDDQVLGFIANFLGIFSFALIIAYHLVMSNLKYKAS